MLNTLVYSIQIGVTSDALEFLLNQAELNEAASVGKIIIQSLSLAEYRTERKTLYRLLQKFQRWFKQDDKLRKFRGVINYVRATKEVERKNGEDTEDLRQRAHTRSERPITVVRKLLLATACPSMNYGAHINVKKIY